MRKTIGAKIVCNNRKARFNYFFLELIEAGIVLKGSEVKSHYVNLNLKSGKLAALGTTRKEKNQVHAQLIHSSNPLTH